MAGDSFGDKIKELPTTTKVGAGVGIVLLLVLAWAWWPDPQPKIDPAEAARQAALKNDKDANPPVADVPPSADGPRRKATKTK